MFSRQLFAILAMFFQAPQITWSVRGLSLFFFSSSKKSPWRRRRWCKRERGSKNGEEKQRLLTSPLANGGGAKNKTSGGPFGDASGKKVSVLLSASVKRFGVFRIAGFFFQYINLKYGILKLKSAVFTPSSEGYIANLQISQRAQELDQQRINSGWK